MYYAIHTIIALLIGLPRPLGVKSQAYQAIAHLYIGGLIATYYITRDEFWLYLIVSLSILETVCFVAFKKKAKPAISATSVEGDV